MKTIKSTPDDLKKTRQAAVQAGKNFLVSDIDGPKFKSCLHDLKNSTEIYVLAEFIGIEAAMCREADGALGSLLKGYRDIAYIRFSTKNLVELNLREKMNHKDVYEKIGFELHPADDADRFYAFFYRKTADVEKNKTAFIKYVKNMPNTQKTEEAWLGSLNLHKNDDIKRYCQLRYVLRTCERQGELFKYLPEDIKDFYDNMEGKYKQFTREKKMPCILDKRPINIIDEINDGSVKKLFILMRQNHSNRFFEKKNINNSMGQVSVMPFMNQVETKKRCCTL